jgi:hypothetical protein
MQHAYPGVAQAGSGQFVDHAVVDDDPAGRAEVAAARHKLRERGDDSGPPRSWWEVVDWLVDRVDQPEPIELQPRQHRRLVGQIGVWVVAVQALGDPSAQGVDVEGGA